MPALLDELFGAREAALAPDVRRGLLAVALSAGLSGEELAAIVDPLAVEDARASDVLVVDGGRVRASHPLLAAAALARSSARERRELHLALGRAVSDRLLRARHLAAAASTPSVELAGGAVDGGGARSGTGRTVGCCRAGAARAASDADRRARV